jgi:hypothetical protein
MTCAADILVREARDGEGMTLFLTFEMHQRSYAVS